MKKKFLTDDKGGLRTSSKKGKFKTVAELFHMGGNGYGSPEYFPNKKK